MRDQTPTVGTLTGTPDPVTWPDPLTLTATDVTDDGAVTGVSFYRETNGLPGLQVGDFGDLFVGTDPDGSDGWSFDVPTTSLDNGTYTLWSQATDDAGLIGTPASTIGTVIGAPPPAVSSSQFLFDALPQQLTFTFSQDISASLSLADIVVEDLTSGTIVTPSALSYDLASNTATVTFSGILADANYRATVLAADITSPGGTPMAADHLLDFFFLTGDANHDRSVDITDLGILATNWQATGMLFGDGDFNYDGTVDITDLGLLATKWQVNLPAAASRPAAPAGRKSTPWLKALDSLGLRQPRAKYILARRLAAPLAGVTRGVESPAAPQGRGRELCKSCPPARGNIALGSVLHITHPRCG